MTQSFRICTVIPAYNRGHLIGEALDSIEKQTRLPDEVIVVDDGSTDDTLEVVRQWDQTHDLTLRIFEQTNQGAAAARNTAIRATDADLIAPLDSDDVWVPEHVEMLEQAFLRHPELVVSAGNTKRLDDLPLFKRVAYGEELFERMEYETAEDGLRIVKGSAFASLLKGAYIQTSSCMFRRKEAVEVGLFDDTLRSYEDQLFFLRLSRRGAFALYMEPVTLLRKHDDNITHRRHIASHIVCAIAALEKAVDDAEKMELSVEEKDALHGVLAAKVNNAADRASRYGIKPYWTVCRELVRRGYLRSLARPKSMARAILRPKGDQAMLQQTTPQPTPASPSAT